MKDAKTLVYEKTGELEYIEIKCRIKSINLKRRYSFIKIQKEIDLTGKNG